MMCRKNKLMMIKRINYDRQMSRHAKGKRKLCWNSNACKVICTSRSRCHFFIASGNTVSSCKYTLQCPRRDFVQFITLLFVQEDYNESCLNTSNPSKFKDMIFIRIFFQLKILDFGDVLKYS